MAGEPDGPDGPVGAALVEEEPHRAGGLLDRLGTVPVGEHVRDVAGRNAGAPDAGGADPLPPRRVGRRWRRAGRPAARRSGPRADRCWRPCAAARWRRGADRRWDCAAAARRSPPRRARRSRRPARPRSRRRNRPARPSSIRPAAAPGPRSHHGRSPCLAMKVARPNAGRGACGTVRAPRAPAGRPHIAMARAQPPMYWDWRGYCTIVHNSQGAWSWRVRSCRWPDHRRRLSGATFAVAAAAGCSPGSTRVQGSATWTGAIADNNGSPRQTRHEEIM